MEDVGIIADLQCGGWSTVILNSKGQLYVLGMLEGLTTFDQSTKLKMLRYPLGFAPPSERYDASTATQQFSTGRSHILGLSDSGRIWSWNNANRDGLHIRFLTIDLVENNREDGQYTQGRVKKVMAGWGKSTALIEGRGIVVWEPVNNGHLQIPHEGQQQEAIDAALITDIWLVPNTEFSHGKRNSPHYSNNKELGEEVGEVINYAVLAEFILFVTHLGKVFAVKIPKNNETISQTFEITTKPKEAIQIPDPEDFAIDVQGSHLSFAVLKRNGEILTSDQTYLSTLWSSLFNPSHDPATQIPEVRKIPCLQNTGVISLAFGDYHFHALHADGSISSHGDEPLFCGALGLGGDGIEVVRGVVGTGFGRDGRLLQGCATLGRRVCFEEEKRLWMDYVRLGNLDRREAEVRVLACTQREEVRAEVSDWFETRLRNWEKGPEDSEDGMTEDVDDDGLPAYFALSVAAAGWHSGALVLVNEAKAKRTRDRYRVDAPPSTKDVIEDNSEIIPTVSTPEPGMTKTERSEPDTSGGMLNSILSAINNGARWFLGLPPNTDPTVPNDAQSPSTSRAHHRVHLPEGAAAPSRNRPPSPTQMPFRIPLLSQSRNSNDHGPSGLHAERKWVWEDKETFPRLRLRSGEVLAGTAPIVEN